MRDTLTVRELRALENVPETKNREFLRKLFLNSERPRSLPSVKELAAWALVPLVIYGIAFVEGGFHNLAIVFVVAFAIFQIPLMGLVNVAMAMAMNSIEDGDDDAIPKMAKLYADLGVRLILRGKVYRSFWFTVDVVIWATLIVSGSIFWGVVVIVLDLAFRTMLFATTNNLRSIVLTSFRIASDMRN